MSIEIVAIERIGCLCMSISNSVVLNSNGGIDSDGFILVAIESNEYETVAIDSNEYETVAIDSNGGGNDGVS